MAEPDRGQVWAGVLTHLKQHHPGVCRHWFNEIEPIGVADQQLVLRALTPLQRDYLRRECLEAFNDAAQSSTGMLLTTRFIGPDDEPPSGTWQDLERPQRTSFRDASGRRTSGVDPEAGGSVGPGSGQKSGPVSGSGSGGWAGGAIGRGRAHGPAGPGRDAGGEPEEFGGFSQGLSPQGPERVAEGPAPGGVVPPEPPSVRRSAFRHTPSEASLAQHPDAIQINPDFGFETFVVGPTNRLAYAAAVAVAEQPGAAYNPLFIHGDVGLGKTHLLQAICVRVREENPGAVLHYISCDGFIADFMTSVQGGRMSEFRHRFRDVDVLVIDDIHFLANRDRTQEEFFHTFNSLYQHHKQIVLSSDRSPEEIPDVEDRLVSRFKWGLVAQVDPPSYETRVAILLSKANLRGIHLGREVAEFVAERLDSNIRELEGAITRLQIQSAVDGRPISLDLAQSALGAEPAARTPRAPTMESIINAVCSYYEIKRSDLLGKRRPQSIIVPRQVGMLLARRLTKHSLEEIGASFGGRDHTTVMHAMKAVESKRERDPHISAAIEALERKVLEQA